MRISKCDNNFQHAKLAENELISSYSCERLSALSVLALEPKICTVAFLLSKLILGFNIKAFNTTPL